MIAAIDLSPHLRDARRALLYLFVGLGQGLTYLLIIGGGLVLGVVLAPLWIGLPILAGTIRLTWRLAEGERRQANRLLATHLPPVPRPAPRRLREELEQRGVLARGGDAAAQAAGRAARARWSRSRRSCWPSRWPGSASAGSRARTAGSSGRGSSARRSGSRCACSRSRPRSSRSPRSRASARRCGLLSRRLLRTRVAEGGPVRELLAERLGDRSLTIAYWLPEREIFVDDTGRQVTLPEPGSGRTWTAVDRGGVRLAAIVHDAELDASPRAASPRRPAPPRWRSTTSA